MIGGGGSWQRKISGSQSRAGAEGVGGSGRRRVRPPACSTGRIGRRGAGAGAARGRTSCGLYAAGTTGK